MKRVGLIAGNGRFPFLAAEEIKKEGNEVFAIALKEETDPSLEKTVDKIVWLPLGKLQAMIDFFKKENIAEALMAGQVKHAKLFDALKLDLRAVKLLSGLKDKKADTILGAVSYEFEKEGVKLLPSHQFLKHMLPKKGLITGKKPNKEDQRDIEFGHNIAKHIAGLDIGQSVVVKDRCVLAVESIEGTDECIRRGASLGKEDVVVVKVAKPNQDFRFDIPVIGPKTIEVMSEVKAKIIAIDSEMTLLIEKEKLMKLANENNITIVAL
ncbi:MAG: UDP-2,3-diacylglucosamine diphosphatase LpxI [Elusimicrobia bacterium]|nr:UDP-2,3-diacylglucosamine diphosphatase LpxI [Candidatus Liberimonas magnetica]